MKNIIKLFVIMIFAFAVVCATSFLTNRSTFSKWEIKNNSIYKTSISWVRFEWTNDTFGGKHFERTSMNIPCKVEGLPNNFTFQFDLGADFTGIYENTFSSFYTLKPHLKNRIRRFKSPLQFWDKDKCLENLKISFGNYTATNKTGFIYKNFGDKSETIKPNDTIHIGSIGTDLFQNKILIIDYPNEQFAICDNIPKEYVGNFTDIELNKAGKIILPMKIHSNFYRIMFDNGSSIFPIITEAKNIRNFSILPDIDTIQVSSWRQIHGVTGKMIRDSFEPAGQKFSNIKVYANHTGFGIDKHTDGMAGNALFWDKTIIIDFKNKKFGVK